MRHRLLPAILALVWPAAAARALPPEVSRVLHTVDFEERRLGNHEDLPMHWAKVEGPGLPHYVSGRLATDRHRGGDYSFRFDLNGGSLIYRYGPGPVRARAGGHYRVEVYCQTTALPKARARLTAYLTDVDGRPIAGTVRHSELYAARSEDEGWAKLGVELSADSPATEYLVVELGLLQPSHYAASTLGPHALFSQDIHGSAWFDDLTISQVPRVTLATDRPGNVFRAGEPLRLGVQVDDRFTEDLVARLVVCDAEGREVYQRSGSLDLAAAQTPGPGRKRIALDLPDLKPGWYEASLAMSSQGQDLGEQALDLVRLPPDLRPPSPDPRFGVIATDLPVEAWGELSEVLPLLSVGRVKLAVWSESNDVEATDPAGFDELVERLQKQGIVPTACLVDLPRSVSDKVGGGGLARLAGARKEDWQPQLAYLISRHANHVDRWQLGADGTDAFVTQPAMRKAYGAVYRQFTSLVEKPDLAMPWPAWYDLQGELPATVALSVPSSVLPSQLPLYMEDLRGGAAGRAVSLSLGLLDRDRYGREAQARDLAQRVIFALTADARRIDFPLPLAARHDGDSWAKQPQELLMVMRTLVATLGGSTYRGRVPLADGVEAFLFDRDGQGVIALWDRGNVAGVKRMPLNFGEGAASVDLWGNVTPLLAPAPQSAGGGGGGANDVQLTVGPMPQFLVDIDGAQAQLRASVAFDRPLLESSFEPHSRRVRFVNPYRQAISGTLKLAGPVGWNFNPPTFTFALNPGEAFDREVSVSFPYNSLAGQKVLHCEFAVQGERNSAFSVPVVLKLGLSDVSMQALALRDGNDVVVQQLVTNYGDTPVDYTGFALYPGEPRQQRPVANLGPGQTIMKRYRFTNVKVTPEVKVRLGLKEVQGARVLNDEVPVQ